MQVPVIVSGEDLESRADGKSNQGHIWILESYAIDVVALRAGNRAARSCIAGDETVENRRPYLRCDRRRLSRRACPRLLRRRFDVPPKEPASEPTRRNLVDRPRGVAAQRRENRLDVDLVREAEMLQTLSNAPDARMRLPVELCDSETLRERGRSRISRVELRRDATAPRRNACDGFAAHRRRRGYRPIIRTVNDPGMTGAAPPRPPGGVGGAGRRSTLMT